MEKEKLIELGRQLGLESDALRDWVERECAQAREEQAKEREFAREYAEQQQKLKEQERKILELKFRLDESSRRLQPTATGEGEGSNGRAWESRRVLEKLARRIGFEGAELKVWVEEHLAAELAKEQEEIDYEREMRKKRNGTIKKDEELEELKTITLGLKVKVAEAENINVEIQRREQSSEESSNEPVLKVLSKGIPYINEPFLSGDHVHRRGISPELQLSANTHDGRLAGSRGTNWSSHVLDGADWKSESEEHGSSTEEQLSCSASETLNTFEEVRDPLEYGGECRAGNSEAFTGHCSGVPLDAVRHVIGMVHDHLRDPLINEGKLEVCRVPEGQQHAIVPTLARDIHDPDASTPELCPINETPNSASVFAQGFLSTSASTVSTNVHARSGVFMSLNSITVQVSRALPPNRRKLCVDTTGGNFRARLALCAWRQRFQLSHHCVLADSSTQRPSILLLVHCPDTYGRRLLEAFPMLIAKGRKSVVRLVWDAIT